MIPTQTLRERMREALEAQFRSWSGIEWTPVWHEAVIEPLVQAAIDAIGDPVLIKTADTKEPTFTLRAQDAAAPYALNAWIAILPDKLRSGRVQKIADAITHRDAFEAWSPRKWPD